jgi:hypothetical protein
MDVTLSPQAQSGLGMEQKCYNNEGQGSWRRPFQGGGLVFSPAGQRPCAPVVSLRADLHVSDLSLDLASLRSPGL